MTTDTYNGWSNRATWLVALHLNNDQQMQSEALRQAEREYRLAVLEADTDILETAQRVDRYATSRVATAMQELVESLVRDGEVDLLTSDLMGDTLSRVDWDEIADDFLEDVERVTEQEQGVDA